MLFFIFYKTVNLILLFITITFYKGLLMIKFIVITFYKNIHKTKINN